MSKYTTQDSNLQQDVENNLNNYSIERCPHDCDNPYVIANRDIIRNPSLSPSAKWLLIYMLTFDRSWKFSKTYIMKNQDLKKDALNSMFKELIKEGHIKEEQYVVKGLKRVKYLVSELPKFKNINTNADSPQSFSPQSFKPTTVESAPKNNKEEEKNNNKKKKEDICSEQSKKTDSKPDFYFSSSDGVFIGITENDMQQWKIAYPSINLEQQIAKALEWLKSNPTKAKLKKKWRSYLTGWLSRDEEKISNKQAYAQSNSKAASNARFEGEAKSTTWKPKNVIKAAE